MKSFTLETDILLYTGYLILEDRHLYYVAPISCIKKRQLNEMYSKRWYRKNEVWMFSKSRYDYITIDGMRI